MRRGGALAVTKAVADKAQLELLDLDANEISDSAVDDIKVHQVATPFCSRQQHIRQAIMLATLCLLASCITVADSVELHASHQRVTERCMSNFVVCAARQASNRSA